MDRDEMIKNLKGRKLFEGLPSQVHEHNEQLHVRKDAMGYYISFKDRPGMVPGTENFKEWGDAKAFLSQNWKRLLDEEFERSFLEVDNVE